MRGGLIALESVALVVPGRGVAYSVSVYAWPVNLDSRRPGQTDVPPRRRQDGLTKLIDAAAEFSEPLCQFTEAREQSERAATPTSRDGRC